MTEPVLSPRSLNRAVLARQLLLARADLPPERVLERVGGLQTQYAPSGYLGMWSRVVDFRRNALTDSLCAGRAIQGWVMRSTIHMVSAADYPALTEAVRLPRRAWRLRADKRAAELDMDAVASAVRRYLADGPRKQAELVALLVADGFPRWAWIGVQLWVDLVRVPPAGTWEKPRAHMFALARQWLPEMAAAPEPSEAQGQELLVRRYLAGFGPASAPDVASFCGWTVTAARSVLARLELRRFRDEAGGELLDVLGGALPPADTPAPVRFLPTWDATLLVHARRAQILPEQYRSRVFATSMPQSVPTFLIDGQVAGTWRYVDGHIDLAPFHDLPATNRRELDEEAQRLTAFYAE